MKVFVLRDCATIIRRGGAEKLELSSKNLDSAPLQNKKISSNPPSVMLKITSHPPPLPPHW